MTFSNVRDRTDVVGFSASDQDIIMSNLNIAYHGSPTAKKMFDDWLFIPENRIVITHTQNDARALLGTGEVWIDLDFPSTVPYINDKGKAVPSSLLGVITHELGHALHGTHDNPSATDYQGDNVRFVNQIWKELGLDLEISYEAVDGNGILTVGYEYTGGRSIDAAWIDQISKEHTWNSSPLGLSNDLLIGGSDSNHLSSGDGNDFLYGAGGDDELHGGAGDDFLEGGAGGDGLDGGPGIDTASYAREPAGVSIGFFEGGVSGEDKQSDLGLVGTDSGTDIIRGIENLVGSAFDDLLSGNSGANILDGGSGNDIFYGGAGNDTFFGGDGVDIAEFSRMAAEYKISFITASVYRITGPDGNDLLNGVELLQFDGSPPTLIENVLTGYPGSASPASRIDVITNIYGSIGDVIGNIDRVGNINWFRTELSAGTTYWINMEGSATGRGAVSDPYLRLFDMNGVTVLASDDNSGVGLNASLNYTPTVSGIYYIATQALDSFSGVSSGSYWLSQRVADDYASNPATVGTLNLENVVSATYDFVADTDWFSTTLTAGTTYRFDAESQPTGPGTQIHPMLRLFGDDGATQLASDLGGGALGGKYSASISYTPTTTGTYYVSAESYGSSVGDYRLSETAIFAVSHSA